MKAKLNQAVALPFPLLDGGSAKITGGVNGDFSSVVQLNGAGNGATVTVAEVAGDAGNYTATITPNAIGRWYVEVTHTATGAIFTELLEVGTDAIAVAGLVDDAGTAYVEAYLEADGEIVTDGLATNCTVTLRDSAGTTVFTSTVAAAPDGNGFYTLTGSISPTLTDNRMYTTTAAITHPVLGVVTTSRAQAVIG